MKITLTKIYQCLLIACFATSCDYVAIQELPYIDVKSNFVVANPVAREGENVIFTQTSTSVVKQFNWTFGDGATSNEPNPSHAYAKYGTYKVTLTVKKEDGVLESTSEREVIIIPKTEWNTNAKVLGDVGVDEQGFCFTPITDLANPNLVIGYLFAGRRGVNILRLLRTDTNFNPTWSEPIDINNLTQGSLTPKSIIQTQDTSFVIVGGYTYNENDEDAFALKIANSADRSLVKEKWRKIRNTSQTDNYSALVEFSGKLLIGGSTLVKDAQGSTSTKLLVETYEKDGALQQSDIYGSNWQINSADFGTQGFAFALTEGSGSNSKPSLIFYSTSFVERRKRTLNFLDGRATDVNTVLNDAGADAGQILVGSYNAPFKNEFGVTQTVKHAFVARLNAFGFLQWKTSLPEDQRIGRVSFYTEEFTRVLQVSDGFVAIGTHQNPLTGKDILVCKYDKEGNLMKYKLLGNTLDDEAFDAKITPDGSFIIFGTTQSTFDLRRRDFYILKLNTNLE